MTEGLNTIGYRNHQRVAKNRTRPIFYVRGVEDKTCTIVDEWCSGFLREIASADNAWPPLLDDKPGILRPFQLFATPEGRGTVGCGGGRGGDVCGVVQ